MDKQNPVSMYPGILLSLTKDGNADICYELGEPRGHYAKWSEPGSKDKECTISLTPRRREQGLEGEVNGGTTRRVRSCGFDRHGRSGDGVGR